MVANMAIPADLQAIMDAAEQAAASNDFPSAARYLREAAALQERTLGPAHPDLANTLNNLGVVCERISEFDEAERSFRRAYAIATTAFPADHEFVATSRANLEEFCFLHGLSFEHQPTPAEPAIKGEATAKRSDEDGESPHQDSPYERRNPEPTGVPIAPARGISFGAIAIVIGIVLMIGLGWMAWRLTDTTHPVKATEVRELPERAAPSDPTPAQQPPTPAPSPPPPQAPAPTPPASSDSPTVVDARVCRSLTTSGAWECDQVAGDAAPGPLYFFTRVAATRDTTVQHRWYVGDRLHQSVMLSIQANPAGYRTYSRTTIGPERTGDWRVELRTEDGRVLTEQRFTVR
jgi:DUF2914 family protein/tetratricopeptide repeat protein